MDLSLIRLFIVIYETCNISKAAEVLNLSQPSVTYNLNLLRKQLNNQLFERAQYGVKPTTTADKLYPVFKTSLFNIEYAISEIKQFNPYTAENVFRICLSDIGEMTILPTLTNYLRDHAPNIILEVKEVKSELVENWLVENIVDVAIFNSSNIDYPKLSYKSLLYEKYVCLVNKNYYNIEKPLSLDDYLNASHIAIKSSTGHTLVDQTLKQLGHKRKIKLVVPHFCILRGILNTSNLIATLPMRAAQDYLNDLNFYIFIPPFEIPGFHVGMHWFQHHEDPIAHQWFIETCENLISNL